jgi:GH15 family glucan-1,4-alpha-glucosidase
MAYKPIESYGVIGDMHSVALVGMDGAIDWCCLPDFDSPSVFAAILDDQKGGTFCIQAIEEGSRKQMYLPDTNILVTRFLSQEGVGEVTDFMPIEEPTTGRRAMLHEIVRIVRCVRGEVRFRLFCKPAFDFAQMPHEVYLDPRGAIFEGSTIRFALLSPIPLERRGGAAVAEFTLRAHESATFILSHVEQEFHGEILDGRLIGERALAETTLFWNRWIGKCRYQGRWREMVHRSALVLKLMTFQPTGAIVAAPTCSLPEEIGGVRNWDYRFTWIRDAAFTIYAFLRLGYTEEAAQFMTWVQERAKERDPGIPLQIMYGIDGRHALPEEHLDHLDGYRGSRPVRVGNAARNQLQLDIYGELMDSIYLYNKYASPISYDLWVYLRDILDWVCENWQQPDHGIWEVRGELQPFVHSKMQCWVALDRGLRIATKRGLPANYDKLRRVASEIYETTVEKGWNEERQSFVQFFGSDAMDATNLLLCLMMFLSPSDPRMLSTLDATMKELVSDSLVYRYEIGRAAGDGLPGREGTFSVCTFWLVEVLARAGRLAEARLIFEKMLTYANHVGLYAEQIGPSGEALGNFPQAFTHLGLVSAALDLDRKLSGAV